MSFIGKGRGCTACQVATQLGCFIGKQHRTLTHLLGIKQLLFIWGQGVDGIPILRFIHKDLLAFRLYFAKLHRLSLGLLRHPSIKVRLFSRLNTRQMCSLHKETLSLLCCRLQNYTENAFSLAYSSPCQYVKWRHFGIYNQKSLDAADI